MGRSMHLAVLAALCCLVRLAKGECDNQTYPKTGDLPQAITFSTPLKELTWLGFEQNADQYVFAMPEPVAHNGHTYLGSELWRSDGYGAADTWRNMTDSIPGLFEPLGNRSAPHFFAGAYKLHHSFGAAHKVLLQGGADRNWVSEDFGHSWETVGSPGGTVGFWAEYKTHPSNGDWLLAMVRRNECLRTWSQLDKWCATDVFVSLDYARTWQNLTENSKGRIASFRDVDWGASFRWGRDQKEAHPDETIFATAYEDPKHMKGPLPAWDKNVHYVMSKDFFTTAHEKLASCGNQFDILNNKVWLALPNNCPYGPDGSKRKLSAEDRVASSVILYMSDDEGTSFTETCLPMSDLDLGYQMRGTFFEGDSSFLVSNHDTESLASANAPVSTIFSSAGNSSLFTLGTSRVFRRGAQVDFVGLDGLPGMYIANRLGFEALTDAAFHHGADITDYEQYVSTWLSYNGGAHWHTLERPKNFTHPQCDTCSELYPDEPWRCQLHLHGPSSWASGQGKLPELHTHWTAPGTVMAVGNVGQYLSFAQDYTCTFISQDGGETWRDIDPRAMVFEFGDAGGILMMAPHQSEHPTDRVHFSLDEGACWHTILLGEMIDVIGIKVEPTASSHIFLVWGQACVKDQYHPNCTHTEEGVPPAGKLFALDVEKILGNEWKLCGDDAYEQRSIPSPDRCLLGRNISTTLRKADAACFNGKGWQRPQGIDDFCTCEQLDTECDFGYEHSWRHNGSCVPMTGFNLDTCPHVRDHSYQISKSGLRLLGGDMCTNLSMIINDTDGRGHSILPRGRPWPHWLVMALALLVASAVLLGIMQLVRSGSVNTEAIIGPFFGAYEWARSKLPGRRGGGSTEYYPLSEN